MKVYIVVVPNSTPYGANPWCAGVFKDGNKALEIYNKIEIDEPVVLFEEEVK